MLLATNNPPLAGQASKTLAFSTSAPARDSPQTHRRPITAHPVTEPHQTSLSLPKLRDRWAGWSVFSRLTANQPNLMRLVLPACVAALVNVQAAESVDVELKRRAGVGN
jgi:hypothetical protein